MTATRSQALLLLRRQIPNAHRLIRTCTGQARAFLQERQAFDPRRVAVETDEKLCVLRVPKLHGAVLAAGGEHTAVRELAADFLARLITFVARQADR